MNSTIYFVTKKMTHPGVLVNHRLPGILATVLMCLISTSFAYASESVPDEALDCLIEPWVRLEVGSSVNGVIDKLLVDRGERVTRGQPLAQLESSVEQADVALAEIRANAQSELDARQAELELAETQMVRTEELFRQNLLPAQERDESSTRYKLASAALKQAVENKKIHQLELRRTQRSYARRIITSPIDGVVLAQLAFSGEFVYDNPLMSIAALDPLRVEVMLPARLFGTIAVGDQAQVFPELGVNNALHATVDVVDALLDARSGTFGVRLTLPNPDHLIPAGQHCRITFDPDLAAAVSNDTSDQASVEMH